MKKFFLSILFVLGGLSVQAQEAAETTRIPFPHIRPQAVYSMPSDEVMAEWAALIKKMNVDDGKQMTEADWKRMEEIESEPILEDLYSGHCSWYCGGEVERVTASSHLKAQGRFNYLPKNAHDFDHESVWAEGAEGQGVGQWIDYEFAGGCPRVTAFKVMGGHVKTKAAYEANTRPMNLKVYYNDKPLCILDLQDVRGMQVFELEERFGPLGYNDPSKPNWHLRFEIMDVYPGAKYEDTVISELIFDGIDVH